MAEPAAVESADPGPVAAAGGPAPSSVEGPRLLRRVAAAFLYRDFRKLWFGAFTSSVGTWMQSVAQNWLVLTLTGSAFFLGLDAFLQQLPIMLFTLIGGVLADRLDRRRTLITSQCIQMSCAFTLTALIYFDVARIWHILTLSFLTGCAQAFGGPAYQSLVPSLVSKRDLPNAIALNSIQFNLARVIGPLVAGAALAAFGMTICFGLNGLSFLVVIVALLSLDVKHIAPASSQSIMTELKSGLSYVRHHPDVLALTLLAAATTFLGFPLLTFLPLFAQNVFHRGVEQYSELMAFSGAGAVSGALFVAWLGKFPRMGLAALVMQVLFGALIIGFAVSRELWLSCTLLFLAGAALMMVFSLVTSLVQLMAPNEMRGRVMSIYMLAFRGGMPLGSLVSGYAASLWSAPVVLGVNGGLMILVAVYFLARNHRLVHPGDL